MHLNLGVTSEGPVIQEFLMLLKMTAMLTWGVIPADQWIKRMPFTNGERTGNAPGVADATTKLGGPDLISTRLWWDVDKANF